MPARIRSFLPYRQKMARNLLLRLPDAGVENPEQSPSCIIPVSRPSAAFGRWPKASLYTGWCTTHDRYRDRRQTPCQNSTAKNYGFTPALTDVDRQREPGAAEHLARDLLDHEQVHLGVVDLHDLQRPLGHERTHSRGETLPRRSAAIASAVYLVARQHLYPCLDRARVGPAQALGVATSLDALDQLYEARPLSGQVEALDLLGDDRFDLDTEAVRAMLHTRRARQQRIHRAALGMPTQQSIEGRPRDAELTGELFCQTRAGRRFFHPLRGPAQELLEQLKALARRGPYAHLILRRLVPHRARHIVSPIPADPAGVSALNAVFRAIKCRRQPSYIRWLRESWGLTNERPPTGLTDETKITR